MIKNKTNNKKTLIKEFYEVLEKETLDNKLKLVNCRDISEAIYTYASGAAEQLKPIATEHLHLYWGDDASIEFGESEAVAVHPDGRRIILFKNERAKQ